MDITSLVAALGLLALWSVWVLSDWRVRSARSIALILLALSAVVVLPLVLPPPWSSLLSIGTAFVAVLPVIIRHSWVMPLSADDAAMVRAISGFERKAVAASELYLRERSIDRFIQRLEEIRRAIRRVRPPDEAWRAVLRDLDDEIRGTLSGVQRRSGVPADAIRARRAAFRAHYTDVLRGRLKFWR